MESNPLVLTDPDLLAEFVRESEFKTFFEKRFASPPDLAALLFRDGALIDSFKGTQFSVGGLWEKMKGLIGGSHHYAVMLADLKPFQVQFAVKGMSKDNVEIAGTATLELQLDPDKPSNILGLMGGVSRSNEDLQTGAQSTTGRKALSRFDVLGRIEPQFKDRVFESVIGRHNADEIRGNRGLQDEIQADMMTEAQRICGDIGVMVKNGSITWAMNEVEREQFERAQIARQQGALDYQLELMKREVARQSESTQVKIEAKVATTKLEQASEDELANMVLNSEVQFIDAREGAARRQEVEALTHEIDILRKERTGRFENELAESGQLIDLTKEKARLRDVEREIDKLDRLQAAEMRKLDAFTDVDIDDAQVKSKQGQTRGWNEIAMENLAKTGNIQEDLADRQADRSIKTNRAGNEDRIAVMDAEARNRVDQLGAAAGMTPEQISAITASYSEGAAAARIEEVKARAAGGEKMAEVVTQLNQQMNDERASSREHELRILETGMKGATGVAYGAGGKSGGPGDTANADADAKVECPSCGKTLSAKAKFCGGCGHQMRT
ncbi:hypothetical protein [uncultured Sphingomonas sp.]|uniref:hypothetical protein n=1 Tax=uncultured Sphingomonas sp. TaxID=158754 RepID=UPI0035C9DA49